MLQVISILCVIITMMVVVHWGKKRCIEIRFSIIVNIMFGIYVFGNLYFTVLSRNAETSTRVYLIPFSSYERLFDLPIEGISSVRGFAAEFLKNSSPLAGVLLNILLYYPMGYLLSILFPKLKPKHVILIGCLCSIATEAIQYILKMGWCETDDVIHNTLGTAIGVWVWLWQSKRLNKPKSNKLPKD